MRPPRSLFHLVFLGTDPNNRPCLWLSIQSPAKSHRDTHTHTQKETERKRRRRTSKRLATLYPRRLSPLRFSAFSFADAAVIVVIVAVSSGKKKERDGAVKMLTPRNMDTQTTRVQIVTVEDAKCPIQPTLVICPRFYARIVPKLFQYWICRPSVGYGCLDRSGWPLSFMRLFQNRMAKFQWRVDWF